jgi:hypothetical protein
MQLSILIPTVLERRKQFDDLVAFIRNIIDLEGLHEEVEILSICDDKEMTIGEKREALYQGAKGEYAWQIDDDDCINAQALRLILEAMEQKPDCITFYEACIIDGKEFRSNFSLTYPDWGEHIDGWDFVRTPFFKTPIKTEICRMVPIPHVRFGEDHLFARAIKPLLKTQVHIPKVLYYYIHNSSPHNERYGIKTD